MKIISKIRFTLWLFLVLPLMSGASSRAIDVPQTIRELLDQYARKNITGVMTFIADKDIVIMGSDLSEVCTSKEQAEELFRNDFQLWDSASFGTFQRMFTTTSGSGDLTTAFFEAPFTMHRGGQEQIVVIRFATVWKRTPHGWKLVQSANTVPTTGQSAKELLAPRHQQ